jgi:1-acyl-sn-glycerol-3-phosphate acyltransferase
VDAGAGPPGRRLLGGIRGAFRLYRDWHRVDRFDRFGRDEFVRMALRYRVPIVPFATVGSAEIFPIWGRIEWPWWRRVAEWPFVPITTPVPLPRWHTEILPPLDVAARYGPEAANDPLLVKKISEDVRARLQGSIDRMRAARPSIFHGRVFETA